MEGDKQRENCNNIIILKNSDQVVGEILGEKVKGEIIGCI